MSERGTNEGNKCHTAIFYSEEAHKCTGARPKNRVFSAVEHTAQEVHHKEGVSGFK